MSIFLAGSIEMGKAENWQDELANMLAHTNITFLNPRRDDWDSSWEQSADADNFREQVEWELQSMHDATMILMYLQPNTLSPISLLELGIYAGSGKLTVCCPDGFWRKGNVELVCEQYGAPLYHTKEVFFADVLAFARNINL